MFEHITPVLRSSLAYGWKLNKAYEKSCAAAGKPYGLTQNEADVLLFLANNSQFDTAMDIVRYRAISKALVSKSVASLRSRGYLAMERKSEDLRNWHLTLLPEALPVVEVLQQAQHTFSTLIEKALTPQEVRGYLAVVDKLNRTLDESD